MEFLRRKRERSFASAQHSSRRPSVTSFIITRADKILTELIFYADF